MISLICIFIIIVLSFLLIVSYKKIAKEKNEEIKLSERLFFVEERLKEERHLREEFFHREFKESDFLAVNLEENYYKIILSMIFAKEASDFFTKGHSEKVGEYARKIAIELSLPRKEVQLIEKCALLHDVGRIGIPDFILNKPDSLNDEEFEIIKSHSIRSEYIASPISSIQNGLSYIRNHHERFNGTGYPDRIKQDEIPLGARIISVADAFSAMTAKRAYRKPLKPDAAIEELSKNAGKQHDPKVIQALLNVIAREKEELSHEEMVALSNE
ncbi:MAG: HD domain-containing phosphohydrolase [bacterium]